MKDETKYRLLAYGATAGFIVTILGILALIFI